MELHQLLGGLQQGDTLGVEQRAKLGIGGSGPSGPGRCPSWSGVDLHQRIARQARHADGRARGIGLLQVRRHDLVHPGEMLEIGEINRKPNRVIQRAICGLRYCLEVVEHAAYLRVDALDHLHGLGIKADLARAIHGVAHAHRLRIGADGFGGVVGVDDSSGHGEKASLRGSFPFRGKGTLVA